MLYELTPNMEEIKKVSRIKYTWKTCFLKSLMEFYHLYRMLLEPPDINTKSKSNFQGSLDLLDASVSEEGKVPERLINFSYFARQPRYLMDAKYIHFPHNST